MQKISADNLKKILNKLRKCTYRISRGDEQNSSDFLDGYHQGIHEIAVRLLWEVRKAKKRNPDV